MDCRVCLFTGPKNWYLKTFYISDNLNSIINKTHSLDTS